MKALVGAFNQEKALVGAFSVIVKPVVEPMDRFAALVEVLSVHPVHSSTGWPPQIPSFINNKHSNLHNTGNPGNISQHSHEVVINTLNDS